MHRQRRESLWSCLPVGRIMDIHLATNSNPSEHESSCHTARRKLTFSNRYGTIASERDATIYACKSSTSNPADGRGAMHTVDTWGDPNPKNVKGTSIAIAYESDINKVTPEMFAVISVNYTSPWFQQTDYRIPGDLPSCPSGGCLCMWCKSYDSFASMPCTRLMYYPDFAQRSLGAFCRRRK